MKIGEKETSLKDLDDTVKCSKKVIEHIRKRIGEENSFKDKLRPQEHTKLSDYEKCFRTTLVRVELFTLCSLGLGKYVCQSFDLIQNEEKKLGRKLTDDEVHRIIVDATKRIVK